MVYKVFPLLFVSLLLAACGGGGGGGSGIDPRLARLDIYEAQRLRVLGDPTAGVQGMAVTSDASLPGTGQAVFQGAATLLIERAADNLSMAGDVTLTVGFGDQSATGAVTNLFGGGAAGGIADYAGSLRLSGGVSDVSFPLDYAGTLTAGTESLSFAGTMVASFLGDPVAGFTARDLEAVIDNNGVIRSGAIVLFGEGAVALPPP